ncbi:MAG: cyclic nucleotide-binding domain-containing protein [Bacteroidota bacterium]
MQHLIAYLESYMPISPQLQEKLASVIDCVQVKKQAFLLERGQRCEHVYFMLQGFARGVKQEGEHEITSWFWKEEDVVTSLHSFLTQKPTDEAIKILEDSCLLRLSYQDLQALYQDHVEFNIIGRKIVEAYFLKTAEITDALRGMNALEKYHHLLELHPDIFQRTTLINISSYLGISRETMSRIRRMG